MKRFIPYLLCMFLLIGCGSHADNKAKTEGNIDLGTDGSELVSISPQQSDYSLFNGEISTNSTQISVHSPQGYQATVYLFNTSDPSTPILQGELHGHEVLTFGNLISATRYLIGITTPNSGIELLLEAK